MKVIIRKHLANLGEPGQIKEVKPGYARNFLIPGGLAEEATEGKIKNWKLGDEKRKQRIAKENDATKKIADKVSGLTLSFTREAGENDALFGSVSKTDIVKSLKASGFEISKEAVNLATPIKVIGDTEVSLTLKTGIVAKVKVRIGPKTN